MAKPRERELEVEEDPQDDVQIDPKVVAQDNDPAEIEPEDDEPEDRDDERMAHVDDEDDDPQPRESRRRRRNRARREAVQASQQEIEALRQQVQQLTGHLEQQSRGQLYLAYREVENNIATLESALGSINARMSKAIADGDAAAIEEARRLEREADARLQNLNVQRARLVQAAQQPALPATQQPQQPAARGPDPQAVAYSRRFMKNNPWFDPEDPTDEDSMVVKAIDTALTNEGFAHSSPEFWQELERRVKARGLGDEDVQDDYEEDDYGRADESRRKETPRRQARRDVGGLPPRQGRTTSRPGGTSAYRLSEFEKETLDQMGLLDEKSLTNEQREQRKRLVTTWKKGMEDARRSGKLK